MYVVYDNLLASIIGMSIVLILMTVNHRGQQIKADALNVYSMRQQTIGFVEILQRDLQNVTSLAQVTEASDSTFSFTARADPSQAVEHTITYRRKRVGTRDNTALFQIERLIDGQRRGLSPPTLVQWTIVARNEEGGQIQNATDARRVVVRFEAVPPFGPGRLINSTRWEATFHPPMLGELIL
jgi:hypothetical protein